MAALLQDFLDFPVPAPWFPPLHLAAAWHFSWLPPGTALAATWLPPGTAPGCLLHRLTVTAVSLSQRVYLEALTVRVVIAIDRTPGVHHRVQSAHVTLHNLSTRPYTIGQQRSGQLACIACLPRAQHCP